MDRHRNNFLQQEMVRTVSFGTSEERAPLFGGTFSLSCMLVFCLRKYCSLRGLGYSQASQETVSVLDDASLLEVRRAALMDAHTDGHIRHGYPKPDPTGGDR